MIIALDVHGADRGVEVAVGGALQALAGSSDVKVVLCGRRQDVEGALAGKPYDKSRVTILDCGEPVTNNDHPGIVVRRKKDASMFRALELVRDGEADAAVSAGNTGALLA